MSDIGNKEIFSGNLKFYMQKFDKTRKDVCDDLGFKYTTFSDWVNGKKYPRIDKIEMLANYFGVEKSDLIEDKSKFSVTPSELTDKNYAQNETERKLLVLCRKANDVSEEEREDIINLFENTIDLYLKAKGIKGDE